MLLVFQGNTKDFGLHKRCFSTGHFSPHFFMDKLFFAFFLKLHLPSPPWQCLVPERSVTSQAHFLFAHWLQSKLFIVRHLKLIGKYSNCPETEVHTHTQTTMQNKAMGQHQMNALCRWPAKISLAGVQSEDSWLIMVVKWLLHGVWLCLDMSRQESTSWHGSALCHLWWMWDLALTWVLCCNCNFTPQRNVWAAQPHPNAIL